MALRHSVFRAGVLAGALLHSAGAAAQDKAGALLVAERAASQASGRDGFAKALRGALAREGALLWAGAPVVSGPDQASRLLSAQRLLDSLRITWQPLAVELSSDGSLGVTWGVAAAARNDSPAQLGRYIAAWRQEDGAWKLAAFVPLGIYPAAATSLPQGLGPMRLPPLAASGPAAAFIAADLAFARLAGDSGAAIAFERYAAPEAVTLGGGLLTRGPTAIGSNLAGGPPTSWTWHPVLAGASGSQDLGWTVGESLITPEGAAGQPGKYLTIWRRLPNGSVRFLTDGGNARPAAP